MEANEATRHYEHDLAALAAEACTLGLLRDGDALEAVTLDHNPLNRITGSIDRLRWPGGTAVRKVVTSAGDGAAHWSASQDPEAWNYWQREVLAYRTDLPRRLGLDAPALLGSVDLATGGVALWLEAVEGRSGRDLCIDDLASVAHTLGVAQARPRQPTDRWLSRRFTAEYAASKPADYRCFEHDDDIWAHPLPADNWPAVVRPGFAQLWKRRHRYHEILDALPRTVCHLDLWPNNIIVRPDGTAALLDWSFTGDGALGEDIGNLVPDAVLDLLVPAAHIDELERRVFAGYLSGLREGGWDGDPALVRLAMTASAVKYHWLPPIFLAHRDDPAHFAYGERTDPAALFAERGVALARLAAWGEEALGLAEELGY